MIEILAAFAGCALLVIVMQDTFEVVLLNRPVRRRLRLMRIFFQAAWVVWSSVSARFEPGPRREAVLGVFGPGAMMLLFLLWSVCIISGFGLLQWGLERPLGSAVGSLSEAIRGSGDAFFTLGYSDLIPHAPLAHALVLIEAGSGFAFIALTITYLPVLDHHFTLRDAKLITMEARAGSPPTAVSLLLWHRRYAVFEYLNEWLRSWELWSAALVESHSSYPMLAFYRSQHSNQSWLASVAVVLDCCTIVLAGFEDDVIQQAECTYMAALRVLTEIHQALVLPDQRQFAGREVDPGLVNQISGTMKEAGFVWQGDDTTITTITTLTSVYEPLLSNISDYLMLALPKWLPPKPQVFGPASARAFAIARLTNYDMKTGTRK